MPYIKIETNVALPEDQANRVLAAVIEAASPVSGKAVERYQGCIACGSNMRMAGGKFPTAHVDYRTIGIGDTAKALSAGICGVLQKELDIPGDRIYITFQVFERALWGKNGTTVV